MRPRNSAWALALLLAGCGGTATTGGAGSSPSSAPRVSIGTGAPMLGTAAAKVEVRDSSFFYNGSGIAPTIAVKTGDIVEWDWAKDDTVAHNVTFVKQPFLDNIDPGASSPHAVNAGATWQVKFTKPGTYSFVCTYHTTNMNGSVTVAP